MGAGHRSAVVPAVVPRTLLVVLTVLFLSAGVEAVDPPAPQPDAPGPSTAAQGEMLRSLFDGRTLAGWKSTDFGGEGEVRVEDGVIILETGQPMTGITFAGEKSELPRSNYELTLEAQRLAGSDFFCGLTFPVGDSHCSFIVGGWGGGVVGLSSIDGADASENDTARYLKFDSDRWYGVRVRVTDAKIETWIDDKQIVDKPIGNRRISTRIEVERSKPLGVSTWQTKAALRNLKLRRLD